MAFDDSGGLDERHRWLAEDIASDPHPMSRNMVEEMDSAFLDEDGNPDWIATDAVKVLKVLDELMDENPFVLQDFAR